MKVFMGSVLRIFLFFFKQKTAYEILACGVQTCALPISRRRAEVGTVSSLDVAPQPTTLIGLRELEDAAARIAPVAVRTPLLPFDHASELLGGDVWLKDRKSVV